MGRALTIAALALAMAGPARAQPINEQLFEMQYFHAAIAPACGVTDAAEGQRLRNAIAAYYATPAGARDAPRIPPARLAALRAKLDRAPPSEQTCAQARRYVPTLQADYPPGGKIERNPPGSPGWKAQARQMAVVQIAGWALRCGAITHDQAAQTIARAEALPVLQFHWTADEITERTRGALQTLSPRRCDGMAALHGYSLEMLAEDETGWQPAE